MPPWLRAYLSVVAALVLITKPHLTDRIRDDQWHLRYLDILKAHEYSLGQETTVAVIDTGVFPHRDINKNILVGTDVISGGAGNGQGDTDSHGTAVAGIIAAHGRDLTSGAMGIAPKAKILPIFATPAGTQGDADNIAIAVEWAVAHDADVVNISYAGGPSPRLRLAMQDAARQNVIVVAAAGNSPGTRVVGFPAAYDGVLAVGAVGRDGEHAELSVTGKAVAITAPGVDIYSTSTNDNYSKGSGTSAATAIVAGAAALVRSKYPELSAREVVHRLTATATDKGPPGRDEQYGYGVLNLVAALTADVPPLSASAAPPATSPAVTPERDGSGRLTAAVLAVVALGLAVPFVLWMLFQRRKGAGFRRR